MNRLIVVVLMSVVAFGCVTMSKQQITELSRIADQPLICHQGQDCEIMWGRAILWITRNSHWKFRQQTDQLITTEGPFDTCFAAFTVNKVPIGNQQYQVIMDCWCGNLFGCVPDILTLKADFTNFVLQYHVQRSNEINDPVSTPSPPTDTHPASPVAPTPPASTAEHVSASRSDAPRQDAVTAADPCIAEIKAQAGTSAKIRTAARLCKEGKITKEERNRIQAAILRGDI